MDILSWEKKLRPNIINNVNIVVSYLKKDDVFVDVGANTGLFTQMILDTVGSDFLSKIILFEPVPYLYDECKLKFQLNNRIIINELALSNHKHTTSILASNINLGYNKIYTTDMEMHPHNSYEVNCVTFSDWVYDNKIDIVNFVKIDAEGHDINVISGMFDWLKDTKQRPYILFEINWYKSLEDELLIDMINNFNYNYINLGRDILLIP
jgi:FkbM family methyltransferase